MLVINTTFTLFVMKLSIHGARTVAHVTINPLDSLSGEQKCLQNVMTVHLGVVEIFQSGESDGQIAFGHLSSHQKKEIGCVSFQCI